MDASKIAMDIAMTVCDRPYIKSLGPDFMRDIAKIVTEAAAEVLTDPNIQVEFFARELMQQQERTDES